MGQTCREAGTESHGSYVDSRVAGEHHENRLAS